MPDIYAYTRTGYAVIDPDDAPDAPERCEGPDIPNARGCGRFTGGAWMCARCRDLSVEYHNELIAEEAALAAAQRAQAYAADWHYDDLPF